MSDLDTKIQDDPEFKALMKDVAEEEPEESPLPEDVKEHKIEAFNADTLLEWWRTSVYARQALTLDELAILFEKEKNVVIERLTWIDGEEFSLSHLVVNGWMGQTGEINGIKLSFKTINMGVAQEIEEKILKYIRDKNANDALTSMESLLQSLPHSWIGFNGKTVVDLAKDKFGIKEPKTDLEYRSLFIADLAQEFVDQVAIAYGEFRRRANLIIRGTLQGN